MSGSLVQRLRGMFADAVITDGLPAFGRDATESRGLAAVPDAVVMPREVQEVAELVAFCYENEVPLTVRGGGSGFAGGCVPLSGGIVVDLAAMNRVLQFDPEYWRIHVQAGLSTADVRRIARESGLWFPPDPGAAESSTIGGNIATNAGGPHAFKYGVTGDYVTGLEAVVPPGEVLRVGGALKKDVAGYDLRGLLVGSEGTLGIVTSAWLRLLPAPEASLPLAATFRSLRAGCDALLDVLASGLQPAVLEYLDSGTVAASRGTYPGPAGDRDEFMVIVEADGTIDAANALLAELREALAPQAESLYAPISRKEVESFWRWRDGVSLSVEAQRGGKVSEDVAVPLDALASMIEQTVEIGRRHGLAACSWGHAGDGNLHSTFMVNPGDADEIDRAQQAAEDVLRAAAAYGGSISGEHGVGWVKRGHLDLQWSPAAVAMHRSIKALIDPKNLLNPGKKT